MATFLGTAKTNNPKVAAVKITSAFGVPLVSKLKISGVLITSTGLQNQPSLLTARISTDSISNIRIQKIKLQNQPVLSGLFLQDGGRILIAKSKVTGPQGRPKTNKAVLEQALRILAVSGRNTPRIKNTGTFNSPFVLTAKIDAARPFTHKRFTIGAKLVSNPLEFAFGKHPFSRPTVRANIPAFNLDRGEEFTKTNVLSAPQIIPKLPKFAKTRVVSNRADIRPTKGLKASTQLSSIVATLANYIRVFGSSAGVKAGAGALDDIGQNIFNADFRVNVTRPVDMFEAAKVLSLLIPSLVEKSFAKIKSIPPARTFTHGQADGILPGTRSPVGIIAGKEGTKDLVLDFGAVKVSRSQINSFDIRGFIQKIQLNAKSAQSKVFTHGQVEGILPGTRSPVGISAGIVKEGDFDRFKLGSGSKSFNSAGNQSGAAVKDQGTWLGVIAGHRSYGAGGYWNQLYPFTSDFWFPQYAPHLVSNIATGFGGGQNIAFSGQPPLDANNNFNTRQAFRFIDGNPTRKVYDNQARYLAQKYQYYTENNGLLDPRTKQARQKNFDTNAIGIADTYISATRIPFKFPWVRIQQDFFLKHVAKGLKSSVSINAGIVTESGIDRFILGRGGKVFTGAKTSKSNLFSKAIVAGTFKQNIIGVKSLLHVPKVFTHGQVEGINPGTRSPVGVSAGIAPKYFHSAGNKSTVNFTHFNVFAQAKRFRTASKTNTVETRYFTGGKNSPVGVSAGKRDDYPGTFFFDYNFHRVNASKAKSFAIPTISFPKSPIKTATENIFSQTKVINAGNFAPNNNGASVSLQDFDVRFLHFAFNVASTKSSNLARGHYYKSTPKVNSIVTKFFRPGTIINEPVYLRSNQPIFTMPFRITGVGAKVESKDILGKVQLPQNYLQVISRAPKVIGVNPTDNKIGLVSEELKFAHGVFKASKPVLTSKDISGRFQLERLNVTAKSVFDLIYKLHTQESMLQVLSNKPEFSHILGRKELKTNVTSSVFKAPLHFDKITAKSVFDLIYKLHTQESITKINDADISFAHILGRKDLKTNAKSLFFPSKIENLKAQAKSAVGKTPTPTKVSATFTTDILESINFILGKTSKTNVTSQFFRGLLDSIKLNAQVKSVPAKTMDLKSYKYTKSVTVTQVPQYVTENMTVNNRGGIQKILWVPKQTGSGTYSSSTSNGTKVFPGSLVSDNAAGRALDHWNPATGFTASFAGNSFSTNRAYSSSGMDYDYYIILHLTAPTDYENNTFPAGGWTGDYGYSWSGRRPFYYNTDTLKITNVTTGKTSKTYEGYDAKVFGYSGNATGVIDNWMVILSSFLTSSQKQFTISSGDTCYADITGYGEHSGRFNFTAGTSDIVTAGRQDAISSGTISGMNGTYYNDSRMNNGGKVTAFGYSTDNTTTNSVISSGLNSSFPILSPSFGTVTSDTRPGRDTALTRTLLTGYLPSYSYTMDEEPTPLWTGSTQIKSNPLDILQSLGRKASQAKANDSGFAYSQNYTVNHDFDGSYVGTESTF